jgi:hypothetical protein
MHGVAPPATTALFDFAATTFPQAQCSYWLLPEKRLETREHA